MTETRSDVRFALTDEQRARWHEDGWLVIEGFLDRDTVEAARADLQALFPDPRSVWREPDPVKKLEQFKGITEFPYDGMALSLATVHARFHDLAAELLGTPDVILYMNQAWAKYTGSADYDQQLHRDFRNHTLLVPRREPRYGQFETMLYLSDVDEACGPTHLVSRRHTADLAWNPEFLPRADYARLYEVEGSAAGPAGSLLVYAPDIVHRGTNLTRPGGSRFVATMGFQVLGNQWMGYHSWPFRGSWEPFARFVRAASPTQLRLIGFPPPGDPYWDEATVAGVEERYGIDLRPFMAGER